MRAFADAAHTYTNQAVDEWNWLAVVFDNGDNTWVVKVYKVDWSVAALTDLITEVIDTTDVFPGTPIAIDVDYINFQIHVLADNGGTIEATVFEYTE